MKKQNPGIVTLLITAACVATIHADPVGCKVQCEHAQKVVTEVAEDRVFDAAVALRVAAQYAENAGNTEVAAKLHTEADRALEYIVTMRGYSDEIMAKKIQAADDRVLEQSRNKTDELDGVRPQPPMPK